MKTKTYKVPLARWFSEYIVFCIFCVALGTKVITGAIALIFHHSGSYASGGKTIAVITIPLVSGLLALATLIVVMRFRGKLVIDDGGISHCSIFRHWFLSWDEIDDWSTLEIEILVSDGSIWKPAAFLRSKEGIIVSVNEKFLTVNRLREIKNLLTSRLGSPNDSENPLIPNECEHIDKRWV